MLNEIPSPNDYSREGEIAIIGGIIRVAIRDYSSGGKRTSRDARRFLFSDKDGMESLLRSMGIINRYIYNARRKAADSLLLRNISLHK